MIGRPLQRLDKPPAPGEHPAIGAVLFDLDNTLLDRNAGFVRFCRELYRRRDAISRVHTEEEAVALMVRFDAVAQRARDDMFRDMMRQWPGVFHDLAQAMDVYLTCYPRQLVLDPMTRELLEGLQDRGMPSAIVTNGGSIIQQNKIRESGLRRLVQAIVISEEQGVAKPDRRIFEHALTEIEADPRHTIFVGDSPDADILGAKELGIHTAWVHLGRRWPYDNKRPDYVVGHVSEVREIVLG